MKNKPTLLELYIRVHQRKLLDALLIARNQANKPGEEYKWQVEIDALVVVLNKLFKEE